MSFGAAASLIAYGEEPAIDTLWQDSACGDFGMLIRDNLRRSGYPAFLSGGGRLTGTLVSGQNLFRPGPLATLSGNAAGRPLFITHGTDDAVVSVRHAFDIATLAAQQDMAFDLWIASDRKHVRALFEQPSEYETRLLQFFDETLRD